MEKAPWSVPIYMQCLSGHLSGEGGENGTAHELCIRIGAATSRLCVVHVLVELPALHQRLIWTEHVVTPQKEI